MAGMSLLRSAVVSRLQCLQRLPFRSDMLMRRGPQLAAVPVRFASHGKRLFFITPSTYYDNRFKRLFKFYVLLGAIPAGIFITLVNIFIGPAELAEIPEGYVPEHWEYHQHPITRWLARYCYPSYDEKYETAMAVINVENEKRQLRLYEDIARASMRKRGDGPWYYYATLDKNLIDNEHKHTPDQ